MLYEPASSVTPATKIGKSFKRPGNTRYETRPLVLMPTFANVRLRPSTDRRAYLLEGLQCSGHRPSRTSAILFQLLNVGLFRYIQRIIHLDPEIAYRAFQLAVAEQKLNGAKVLGPPVDQRSLGPGLKILVLWTQSSCRRFWHIVVSKCGARHARGLETGTALA